MILIVRKATLLRAWLFSVSKNKFFDTLAEINKGAKTSSSTPKCISILERGELRSKSKKPCAASLF